MVDYFAIAVTHGVMALALWRLMTRDDLDREEADESPQGKPKAGPSV